MSFQFNESFYLTSNPDVFLAVATGQMASGLAHYNQFGWVEGRDPNANFDSSYYVSQNPDVAEAVMNGLFESPLQHFQLYGAAEGRAPSEAAAELLAYFDEAAYLAANTDVADAIADGHFNNALQHYQLYGQFEERDGLPELPPVEGNFTLTTGTDIETGGAGDDVFQADAVQTGLLPNQTLNSTDNLDGGEGGWNVLNAQLVDPNVTPAGLSNIQEINISSAPGVAAGLINLIAAPRLNAINADSVEVLGFSALHNDVAIDNLDAGLTDINISNSGPGLLPIVPDININLIGDNLGGEEDALNINLVNADVILDVDHDRSAEGQGYEVINIDSAGSAPGGNWLWLEGSALTAHTVNVTGGTDLRVGEFSLGNLRTFTAAALTANLVAGFAGAAEDEDGETETVEITGAQGDNTLGFAGATGNLVIETFDGDDTVLLDANLFDEDAEGEGVTLDLGGGSNTLVLLQGSFTGGDVSFANADITGVQTLGVVPPFTVNGDGASVDLEGLDELETIVFQGAVTLNGEAVIENAPDALTLTFGATATINGAGSLVIDDTESLTINAHLGADIDGGVVFDDVEDLTINVGTDNNPNRVFDLDGATITANDLETLTVNLINDADFTALFDPGSSATSLESVIVTGDEDSNFSIHFAANFGGDISPDISTIDLSGFDGKANVNVWDFGTYTADAITITIGSGDLDYTGGASDQRETFVFTDGDFGLVQIAAFQTDNAADAASSDRIDLTGLGITSLGQLDIDDDGAGLVTINSDLFEGTIEVNVTGSTADFTDYLIF